MKVNSNYYNLHLIRVGACIAVLMVHLGQNISLPASLQKIFDAGSSGVMVFFMLSGFLGFQSYERLKQQKGSSYRWVLAHCIRLLVVYYAIVLCYMLLSYTSAMSVPSDETGLYWFRYLFCLNQMVPSTEGFWTNLGGTWTVSIFILFYLLLPLLYKWVKSLPHSVLFFVFTYGGARVLEKVTTWGRAFTFLYYFAIGIMLYFAWKEKKERSYTIASLLGLLLLLIIEAQGGLKIAVLLSILIIQSMSYESHSYKISKIVLLVSKYSYSLYLMHLLVVAILNSMAITNDILFTVLFLSGSAVGTILLYHCVEKRVINFCKARL